MRFRLGVAFCATALGAAAILMPAVADAATTPAPAFMPTFTEWQPGTPLPAVPAGWHIQALPSQQSLAGITAGQSITTTMVNSAGATTAQLTALQADENPAGFVNLEVAPGPDSCSVSFVRNVGSEATVVAQSFSTISGTTQEFSYGKGQSSNRLTSDTGTKTGYPWAE